jgi:hypothetical protein
MDQLEQSPITLLYNCSNSHASSSPSYSSLALPYANVTNLTWTILIYFPARVLQFLSYDLTTAISCHATNLGHNNVLAHQVETNGCPDEAVYSKLLSGFHSLKYLLQCFIQFPSPNLRGSNTDVHISDQTCSKKSSGRL